MPSYTRKRANSVPITESGIGATNKSVRGITVEEQGDAINHRSVIKLTKMPITVGNTTGVSFGGVKFYDFPAGPIAIKSVSLGQVTVGLTNSGNATPINGTMGGDISLGSTPPSDGTLTLTDVNLLPSTSIDPISAGIALPATLAAPAVLGSVASPLDAYFNMLIDDADVANAASDILEISAIIVIDWSNLAPLS